MCSWLSWLTLARLPWHANHVALLRAANGVWALALAAVACDAPVVDGLRTSSEAHKKVFATQESRSQLARAVWSGRLAEALLEEPWALGVHGSFPAQQMDASRDAGDPEVIVEVARTSPSAGEIASMIGSIGPLEGPRPPSIVIVLRSDVCDDLPADWAGGVRVEPDGWTRKDLARARGGLRCCL